MNMQSQTIKIGQCLHVDFFRSIFTEDSLIIKQDQIVSRQHFRSNFLINVSFATLHKLTKFNYQTACFPSYSVKCHSWQRDPYLLFHEGTHYIAYLSFPKYCHTSLPCCLPTPPHYSFCCLVSLY